jgi:hypothetical protein
MISSVNKSSTMYVVAHNPDSSDDFRNYSFDLTRRIADEVAEYTSVPGTYPRSSDDLFHSINQLPESWINVLPNHLLGENSIVVNRERILKLFDLWKRIYNTIYEIPDGSTPLAVREVKRFALHLHLWCALEAFLQSRKQFLLYFEDDITLSPQFAEKVHEVIKVLPKNFDVFNFAVKPDDYKNYQEFLRVGQSAISLNYHCSTGACILISRHGARKMLYEMMFEAIEKDAGVNTSRNFDMVFSNAHYNSYNHSQGFYLFFPTDGTRFQTYTFVPGSDDAVEVRFGNSIWWTPARN